MTLFRLCFGQYLHLLKGKKKKKKKYCDKCQWLPLVSIHKWHYRTKCQHEHAGKHEKSLDLGDVWTAQDDILPGQSVCFQENSVVNLPCDTQLKIWKYLTESHKTRTCKTSNKVIYKTELHLCDFDVYVCLASLFQLVRFFCHPINALFYGSIIILYYITLDYITLYYIILSVPQLFSTCQLSLFFFFGSSFVSADKFIEKHGSIIVLTMNNQRQFNNHLLLLQWKSWSESKSSWTCKQTYANEGNAGH